MNTPIVKIDNVSHRYSRVWAIRNISIELDQIGVLGLLGSNGAGKSTTMNILCGVINQTEGNVFIDGIDIRKKPLEAKKLIGFLPQNPPLYPELTVDEYLKHCAGLRLMPEAEIPAAQERVKKLCGIAHFSKRLLKNLSGGYRQRVGIAQAIIHTPKVVVLDEPTNGLDPNQILEVRKLIRDIARERLVIFSSHILSEVQAICKDIRMIEHGELVFSGSMDDFNNYVAPKTLVVRFNNPPSEDALLSIGGVTTVEMLNSGAMRLSFDDAKDISPRIVQLSVEKNWGLSEITFEKSSLDEVFAQLSGNQSKI